MGFNAVQGFGSSPLNWHERLPVPGPEEQIPISQQSSAEVQEIADFKNLPSPSKRVENRTDVAAYKRFYRYPDQAASSLTLSSTYNFKVWSHVVSDIHLSLFSKYVQFTYQSSNKDIEIEHTEEIKAEYWSHLEDNFSRLLADIQAKQSSL